MSEIISNVLKAGQPINTGFDNNSVRNNPIVPGDTQIQNIVDATKVVRPDGKGETEDNRFAFSSESNYGNFIQNLKEMPQLAELFSKLLFTDARSIISSGLNTNFAEELSAFMEMMKMDAGQLLSFMKTQASDTGKYGGIFFQAMRDVLNNTTSLDLRTGILDFLKHYGDMASSNHLMNNIMIELNEIMPYLFKADAQDLSELQAKLIVNQNQGGKAEQNSSPADGKLSDFMDSHIQHNSRILKEDIIPFFSKYITKTHDLGKPRDIMTLITLNVARYVNGDKESVMQSFEKLLQYGDFRQRLGEIKEENLELILNRMLTEQKSGEKNPWTEQFINLLRTGMDGSGGYESKMVFQNVMNALLLNESVYMPLVHLMLPVNLDGNIMFSELWVDPDAQNGHSGSDENERNIRMLVKFDIKNLGFFDVILNYQGGKVDLMVGYPPKLAPMEKAIRNGLGQIVADNGLSFQSLIMEECRKPVALTEVFPKILEGRNSVNVRI